MLHINLIQMIFHQYVYAYKRIAENMKTLSIYIILCSVQSVLSKYSILTIKLQPSIPAFPGLSPLQSPISQGNKHHASALLSFLVLIPAFRILHKLLNTLSLDKTIEIKTAEKALCKDIHHHFNSLALIIQHPEHQCRHFTSRPQRTSDPSIST